VAASQESSNNASGGQVDIAAMVFSYRPSLKAIAASLLPEHLKSHVDDSDLVQETLLKAVAQADQIRATYPEQLEVWLKETLVNSVRDCIKFHGRQQRAISREQFLPLESLCSTDRFVRAVRSRCATCWRDSRPGRKSSFAGSFTTKQ
jgi:DNA-directed RNA polymerase specialized sigma24 family protein